MGAVNICLSNPSKKLGEAIKMILRYLSSPRNKSLCLGGRNVSVIGYTNSDYVGCFDSRKSTSRYIFQFIGGAISWRSHLQECIALSTQQSMLHLVRHVRKLSGFPN